VKIECAEGNMYFGVINMKDILDELGIIYRNKLHTGRILTGPGHYAYLKVSDGCDRTCAFCAIPAIRGKCISRQFEEIVGEASGLAGTGVKELILVAQDLSYYGLDLYKERKLPELVSELAKLRSFDWIRLHYLYPASFPEALIPVIRENPEICRYIDIPIQHISDKILSAMKRTHDRKSTESILSTCRR